MNIPRNVLPAFFALVVALSAAMLPAAYAGGGTTELPDDSVYRLDLPLIDQDGHPTVARFLDDLLDRHQRRTLLASVEIDLQLAQRIGGRIPFWLIERAQRIGVEPGGAGKPGAGNPARGNEIADAIDQHRAHDSANITLQCDESTAFSHRSRFRMWSCD